jgi:hypothetical protein
VRKRYFVHPTRPPITRPETGTASNLSLPSPRTQVVVHPIKKPLICPTWWRFRPAPRNQGCSPPLTLSGSVSQSGIHPTHDFLFPDDLCNYPRICGDPCPGLAPSNFQIQERNPCWNRGVVIAVRGDRSLNTFHSLIHGCHARHIPNTLVASISPAWVLALLICSLGTRDNLKAGTSP